MPCHKILPCVSFKNKINSKVHIFVAKNSPGGTAILWDQITNGTHKIACFSGSKMNAQELQFSGQKLNTNAQFQPFKIKPIWIVSKRHEPCGWVAQELANHPQEGNLGFHIYEEGEEEELLEHCRAEDARSGDLFYMHSEKKKKKAHTRKKSWDGNMMRVAKQNGAVSTRSSRSKKEWWSLKIFWR